MFEGKDLKAVSKILRKAMTPWEAKLWYHLRGNRFYGFKFKRQVPMGNYVVDFCCQEKRLVIECDGGQHTEADIMQKDKEKEQFIESRRYKVLRFQNIDIDNNLEGVLEGIRRSII